MRVWRRCGVLGSRSNDGLHVIGTEQKLPIEDNIAGPPPLMLSGLRARPMYVCNGTIESDATGAIGYDWSGECLRNCDEGTCYEVSRKGAQQLVPSCSLPPSLTHSLTCCVCVAAGANETREAQIIVEAYTDYVDVIMSEAQREYSSLTTESPARLLIQKRDDDLRDNVVTTVFLAKARAMVQKMPGFFFSGYSQSANGAPVIITMEVRALDAPPLSPITCRP